MKNNYTNSIKNSKYFCVLVFIILSGSIHGQKFKEMIKDSVDQKFDMSGVLNSDLSFMPVPIIIMEPAVGYGGGKITIGSHWGR